MTLRDYKGNELSNLVVFGIRRGDGKGYDLVSPKYHALKDYAKWQVDKDIWDGTTAIKTYDETVDDQYALVLRQATLFNVED